jgi:hypothetical protein
MPSSDLAMNFQASRNYNHIPTLPTYGATVQFAKADNSSLSAINVEGKYIRQVIGVLLYYGGELDSLASAHL